MRNLPRLVSLSLVAFSAALLLSACGGESATASRTPTASNAVPSTPLPQAGTPAPGESPQADAGDAPLQPSDYKPDPTYLPDDSHLGAAS